MALRALGTFFYFSHLIDKLEPPTRDIASPFRFPISNVLKGSGSATGVTGRVCAGAVQTGERLRIVPGDESGIVKSEGAVPNLDLLLNFPFK